MGCSCIGLTAIVFSSIALVLTTISLGLPLWSRADETNNEAVGPSNFLSLDSKTSAGVWGICLNFEINSNVSNFDSNWEGSECFYYFSSKDPADITTKFNDILNVDLQKKVSFCDEDMFMDSNSTFKTRTCGSIGKATLSFSVLSMVFGLLMVIFLLLGVTCCKKSSSIVSFAAYLGVFAGIFCILAFSLWAYQAQVGSNEENLKFSVSWYFSIFSAIFFFVASMFTFKHIRKGVEEEVQQQGYQQQQATPLGNPPEQHGPMTRNVPNTLV